MNAYCGCNSNYQINKDLARKNFQSSIFQKDFGNDFKRYSSL